MTEAGYLVAMQQRNYEVDNQRRPVSLLCVPLTCNHYRVLGRPFPHLQEPIHLCYGLKQHSCTDWRAISTALTSVCATAINCLVVFLWAFSYMLSLSGAMRIHPKPCTSDPERVAALNDKLIEQTR